MINYIERRKDIATLAGLYGSCRANACTANCKATISDHQKCENRPY